MWLVFFLLVVVDGQCDFPVYTELPDDWKNKAFVLKSPDLNEEFRIKWPRGELGALPDDARQDLRIEYLQRDLAALEEIIKEHLSEHDAQ